MVYEIQTHLKYIYIYIYLVWCSYLAALNVSTFVAIPSQPYRLVHLLAHKNDQEKEELPVSLFNTCENQQLQMENA